MADGMHPVWHHYKCDSGTCIEVAKFDEMILIRDSKDPYGPVLRFSQGEWEAFVLGLRTGDLPLA